MRSAMNTTVQNLKESKQSPALQASISRFVDWLDRFGETSYDHQSFFASDLGRKAKALYYRKPLLGKLAVSPMILSEAFLPSTRRFFFKKQRFPIADAHYAMGFAFLFKTFGNRSYYERSVHFLQVLEETRSPGFAHHGWGYPFHWETRLGVIPAGTPMITTLPYVYEAFRQVYEIDGQSHWREVMKSIAQHGLLDYQDNDTSATASTCSYYPGGANSHGVLNASAYRAFLLTQAAVDFGDDRYHRAAERNLNFVLENQNADGSWFYSTDGQRDFVDHFHTCFVLKALTKIEALTKNPACTEAIERGVQYYIDNLFDGENMPKPFSRAPRMTVYRNELYDYAESINLATLLRGRFSFLDHLLEAAPNPQWQKADGSFRARKLLVGWDNTPMHRWAQSQMFRSLCFALQQQTENVRYQ
jgi:hypothetical protein